MKLQNLISTILLILVTVGVGSAVTEGAELNRRKFGGKELMSHHGLNLYDFAARLHNPAFPHFTTPEPLLEKYYPISPFAYCAGDPINLIDPTGMHTLVIHKGDGIYKVVGGELNEDLNIYIATYNPEDKTYYNTGISIGQTVTPTSFYNSDIKKCVFPM